MIKYTFPPYYSIEVIAEVIKQLDTVFPENHLETDENGIYLVLDCKDLPKDQIFKLGTLIGSLLMLISNSTKETLVKS